MSWVRTLIFPPVSMNDTSSVASWNQLHKGLLTGSLLSHHIPAGMTDTLALGCSDWPFPPISRSGSSYCYECLRAACNFNKSLYSGSPLGSNLPCWESESIDKHCDCSHREKSWWLQSPFAEAREKREASGCLWRLLGARGWGHRWSPAHDRSLEEISHLRTCHSSHPLDPNHLKRVLYLTLSGQIPQVPLNFKIM